MSLMRENTNEIDAWWDSFQAIRCPIMQQILLHFEYGRHYGFESVMMTQQDFLIFRSKSEDGDNLIMEKRP